MYPLLSVSYVFIWKYLQSVSHRTCSNFFSLMFFLQSQEVAKDFGAVCTPEFFLFKKVMTTRVISESFKVSMTHHTPVLKFKHTFLSLVSFLNICIISLMDVFYPLVWNPLNHSSWLSIPVLTGGIVVFHSFLSSQVNTTNIFSKPLNKYSHKSCKAMLLLLFWELFAELKNFILWQDGRRPFELVYHGQFDDSRPSNNAPVTGRLVTLSIQFSLRNLVYYCKFLI